MPHRINRHVSGFTQRQVVKKLYLIQSINTVCRVMHSKAILDDTTVPISLDDSINNMRVIEAIVHSARQNKWTEITGIGEKSLTV